MTGQAHELSTGRESPVVAGKCNWHETQPVWTEGQTEGVLARDGKGKAPPCTGTEALCRLYGP